MYSPRLYKYRDSYVLYIPTVLTVHAFGSVLLTHTLWYRHTRHTHMTFPPPADSKRLRFSITYEHSLVQTHSTSQTWRFRPLLTVNVFGSVLLTHTLWYRHTRHHKHDVSAPCFCILNCLLFVMPPLLPWFIPTKLWDFIDDPKTLKYNNFKVYFEFLP